MQKIKPGVLKPSPINIEVSSFNPTQRKPVEPKLEYKDQYLTFKALEDSIFKLKLEYMNNNGSIISYSIDNGKTWTTHQVNSYSTETITTQKISKGKTILWKGNLYGNYYPGLDQTFSSTGKYEVYGNVMSLLYEDNFKNKTQFTDNCRTFANLFRESTTLTNAKNLILPITTLTTECYKQMFYGCTSLLNAPKILPATILTRSCYDSMFYYCESLISTPQLPATTLDNMCYYGMFTCCYALKNVPQLPATELSDACYMTMFSNCTSLINAPQLPATTLANSCYNSMFNGCTSLINAPQLPATTLVNNCYLGMFSNCTSLTTAPELPATTLADCCYNSMFWDCTSLTTPPKLPATVLTEACYDSMFRNCISLTIAPELPAPTLITDCYYGMFYNCSNLNYIKALFRSVTFNSYIKGWVHGVSQNGTFVKSRNASWNITGDNGIPQGWTVETE